MGLRAFNKLKEDTMENIGKKCSLVAKGFVALLTFAALMAFSNIAYANEETGGMEQQEASQQSILAVDYEIYNEAGEYIATVSVEPWEYIHDVLWSQVQAPQGYEVASFTWPAGDEVINGLFQTGGFFQGQEITVHYKQLNYNISFVTDQGISTVTTDENFMVQEPFVEANSQGAYFDHWVDDNGKQYSAGEISCQPWYTQMTFTAVYNDMYTVTFDDCLESTEDISIQVNAGYAVPKNLIPTDPENPGWEFLGWFNADGTEWDPASLVNENIKIYAHWEEAPAINPGVNTTDNENLSNDKVANQSLSTENTGELPDTGDSTFLYASVACLVALVALAGIVMTSVKRIFFK